MRRSLRRNHNSATRTIHYLYKAKKERKMEKKIKNKIKKTLKLVAMLIIVLSQKKYSMPVSVIGIRGDRQTMKEIII